MFGCPPIYMLQLEISQINPGHTYHMNLAHLEPYGQNHSPWLVSSPVQNFHFYDDVTNQNLHHCHESAKSRSPLTSCQRRHMLVVWVIASLAHVVNICKASYNISVFNGCNNYPPTDRHDPDSSERTLTGLRNCSSRVALAVWKPETHSQCL